ncbi:unnamed protein product [Zymoseptoria tritici ST99CH_1E4]|uniref:Uncharacterized protein n=1 Tax=Zymoseptoria tritici ST99CH_1E4 TaxID=1276532 RepID=A0A2H1FXQ1_ZYMTR|nr:unnamed protein product [Zymoseptoria tritici ST99CH_1E4]
MADSCIEWVLRALIQHEEPEERGADPPRDRESTTAFFLGACRKLFRVERSPKFVVRTWRVSKSKPPRTSRSHIASAPTSALAGLRTALKSMVRIDKEIQSSVEHVQAEDQKLAIQLLNASPLALHKNEEFVQDLAVRNALWHSLQRLKTARVAAIDTVRRSASELCEGVEATILTPVFNELLRHVLKSLNSALDSRSKASELGMQLRHLQQLEERSKQLFMTSGKGWRVSPSKVTMRIQDVTDELCFLEQTELSRERVAEETLKAFLECETTKTWIHSRKSIEALIAAEVYRSDVKDLGRHRERLDDDKLFYYGGLLKKSEGRSQEQYESACLEDLLLATKNVKICEALVRISRTAAIAAGASLICLDEVNPDYITEIGHGVELSRDGRAESESSEQLRFNDAYFQLRLDPILKWQSCLHEANDGVDDVEIPASPTSSAESNTSEYYTFYPWDVSADIYERRLVPCDSISNVNWGGMERKIKSERLRQETARSALNVRPSSPPRSHCREDTRRDDRYVSWESRGDEYRSASSRDRFPGEDRAIRRYDRYMPEGPADAQWYDEYRSLSPRGRSRGENRAIRRDSRDLPE